MYITQNKAILVYFTVKSLHITNVVIICWFSTVYTSIVFAGYKVPIYY